jgi:nitronate monooxygenase
VQMATRFVTTYECDASENFKQTYLDSRKEDIVVIKSPVGMPGRAIKNAFLDEISQGKRKPFKCPYHCIITCDYKKSPYCIAFALINAKKGNFSHGFAFAGENAHRAKEIISVKELKEGLKLEKKPRMVVYHDLDHLAGTWSDKDYSEFQKKVADFEKIDKDLW